MKCIVLAAGYATRLYPLTKDFPKPLLEVGGKSILDWLLDDIDLTGAADEYIIISNHKYYNHFIEWSLRKKLKAPVTVIDDNSATNETRLGAVCDIQYAIDKLNIDDDLLVIAGDNVLDFSFKSFIDYFCKVNTSVVMRYFEQSNEKLKKCGVILCDENEEILKMTEKSPEPMSNWCVPPFYIYKKEDVPLVARGISEGCATDAPGSFIAWLCGRSVVHAMEMPGRRYDIGNLESYEAVKAEYKGIIR